ncbi:MAG: hypothetical protein H0W84_14425, partial [Bacteroidetes bacterium]|nr:hypothetical protein [Bacteroidota bacterium]
MKFKQNLLLFFSLSCFFLSCKKDPKLIPNNNAPYYAGIPTVKVHNYINRLFIDLIGREALDTELAAELAVLRANTLSIGAREQLIVKLQTNDSYLVGDSSYKYAYYNRFYEITKARLLEGIPDSDILSEKGLIDFDILKDSIAGDSVSFQIRKKQSQKLVEVIKAQAYYRMDSIDIRGVYARMLDNAIYDKINMNTFNFVRASFSNLFFRYPSQSELIAAYDIVEYDAPRIILGKSAQNKGEYINVLLNSSE